MEHFPNERLVHTLQYKFIFETSIGNRIFLHYCSNVNLYFKIYDDFVPKWISTNILNNNFQSFSLPFGRRFVLMFFFQESRCQLLKKHRNWVKKNILFLPLFCLDRPQFQWWRNKFRNVKYKSPAYKS